MTGNLGKLQPAAVLPLIQLMMVKLHLPPRNQNLVQLLHYLRACHGLNRKRLSGIQAVESELCRYQDEETIDLDSDPLVWWNSRMCQYPLLAQLVRMVWSLPATSVCSEQVFSAAGNVLTKKRARLLPKNVDKLVLLHRNM